MLKPHTEGNAEVKISKGFDCLDVCQMRWRWAQRAKCEKEGSCRHIHLNLLSSMQVEQQKFVKILKLAGASSYASHWVLHVILAC